MQTAPHVGRGFLAGAAFSAEMVRQTDDLYRIHPFQCVVLAKLLRIQLEWLVT